VAIDQMSSSRKKFRPTRAERKASCKGRLFFMVEALYAAAVQLVNWQRQPVKPDE